MKENKTIQNIISNEIQESLKNTFNIIEDSEKIIERTEIAIGERKTISTIEVSSINIKIDHDRSGITC